MKRLSQNRLCNRDRFHKKAFALAVEILQTICTFIKHFIFYIDEMSTICKEMSAVSAPYPEIGNANLKCTL